MNQVAIVLLMLLFIPNKALADSSVGTDSAGIAYFGMKLGQSSIMNSPTAYGLFGAYTVLGPNMFGANSFLSKLSFSVEGEFVDLGNSVSFVNRISSTASTFGIVGVSTYQINQQFAVLAKAGMASITHKYRSNCVGSWCNFNSTTIGVHIGAAGQYNLSGAMVVRAGYDFYPDGFKMMSVGIASRF